MPVTLWTPEDIAPPASRDSNAVLVDGVARYLSGQIGLDPDGTLAEGLAAQIDRCPANIGTGLSSAGMGRAARGKVTYHLTDGSAETIASHRARRDARDGAHPATATTLLMAAALASATFLVEIDGIAAA